MGTVYESVDILVGRIVHLVFVDNRAFEGSVLKTVFHAESGEDLVG